MNLLLGWAGCAEITRSICICVYELPPATPASYSPKTSQMYLVPTWWCYKKIYDADKTSKTSEKNVRHSKKASKKIIFRGLAGLALTTCILFHLNHFFIDLLLCDFFADHCFKIVCLLSFSCLAYCPPPVVHLFICIFYLWVCVLLSFCLSLPLSTLKSNLRDTFNPSLMRACPQLLNPCRYFGLLPSFPKVPTRWDQNASFGRDFKPDVLPLLGLGFVSPPGLRMGIFHV